MNDVDDNRLIGMLRRVIRDCGKLYQQSAKWMIRRYPTLIEGRAEDFLELMDDLHRGLLVKVYVTVVRADEKWTGPEKMIAAEMIEYLWGQQFHGQELREAATGLFQQADQLSWESLVAPFVRYEPLADSKAQIETIVMRLANLVAKCDGQAMPEELVALHTLQRQIDMALNPADPKSLLAPLAGGTQAASVQTSHPQSSAQQFSSAKQSQQHTEGQPTVPPAAIPLEDREKQLKSAMKELESLVGLDAVKTRVKSYTNFLRLQQQRRDKGLSTMPISLHMTFVGNPGTGKTTVARIVGQILGALGTLESGHVVETDRSGLVAEYAGQTATKTNKLCDSAKGGVLFIDEAYSLFNSSGDDAYGREAIQALLKRMEDDRDRLAVILAGYSEEMDKMIRSNPGLSSRVNTTIEFDDYTPPEMGRIFEGMCQQNQYELRADARHRLIVGFHLLHEKRDKHFGNGRLVRNAFEDSVRCLADRIAEVSELSEDLLTLLSVEDISVPGISSSELDQKIRQPHQLRMPCQGCERKIRVAPTSLGLRVRCGKCHYVQTASWAFVSK